MQVVKVLGAVRHGPVDVPTESVVIDAALEVSRELDRPATADTQEQGVVVMSEDPLSVVPGRRRCHRGRPAARRHGRERRRAWRCEKMKETQEESRQTAAAARPSSSSIRFCSTHPGTAAREAERMVGELSHGDGGAAATAAVGFPRWVIGLGDERSLGTGGADGSGVADNLLALEEAHLGRIADFSRRDGSQSRAAMTECSVEVGAVVAVGVPDTTHRGRFAASRDGDSDERLLAAGTAAVQLARLGEDAPGGHSSSTGEATLDVGRLGATGVAARDVGHASAVSIWAGKATFGDERLLAAGSAAVQLARLGHASAAVGLAEEATCDVGRASGASCRVGPSEEAVIGDGHSFAVGLTVGRSAFGDERRLAAGSAAVQSARLGHAPTAVGLVGEAVVDAGHASGASRRVGPSEEAVICDGQSFAVGPTAGRLACLVGDASAALEAAGDAFSDVGRSDCEACDVGCIDVSVALADETSHDAERGMGRM